MKPVLKIIDKVDSCIVRVSEILCGIMLLSIIGICFTNTVGRYAFGKSFVWADEIVRYMSVWLTLMGASLCAREDGHTTLDIIQEFTKNRKVKAGFYAFTRILSVFFMVALFPYGIEMVKKLGHSRSSASGLPTWVLYSSYPVGMVCIILAYIRVCPVKFMKILKGEQ